MNGTLKYSFYVALVLMILSFLETGELFRVMLMLVSSTAITFSKDEEN